MELNRRQVLTAAAAVGCAAALPPLPLAAAETVRVEMFFTTDGLEPWGCFVRGHLTREQYSRAVVEALKTDSDLRENGEDWLYEGVYDEDGELAERRIVGEPEHRCMRLTATDDPDCGDVYSWCDPAKPGAIPITVIRY